MTKKIKKYQQSLLVILIVICIGIIMIGGINYVKYLQHNLQDNAIQNLMTVTIQQQQDFDKFLADDRRRLHGYADFLTRNSVNPDDIRQLLALPNEKNVDYLVMCLDEGWVCGTSFDDTRQLDEENLDFYSSLSGSGIRDTYTELYSDIPRFGYYETFTFSNGHKGLIQKSYNRSKVSETFPLSFYNDQGYAHIVNQQGDILLRPSSITVNFYDNIFDGISKNQGQQENIDHFMEELQARNTGSMLISRAKDELVYTYVPLETVEEWYLVSVVSADTIMKGTNQILLSFQMALGFLILLLFICAMFILLIWRTQKDLLAKDDEIRYQELLFNSFTAYLANNTNDMYIILDHETEEPEYISPNVERVLGVNEEELIEFFRASDLSAGVEATEAYYAELNALRPGQEVKSRNTVRINPKTGEHKYFVENAYCTNIQGRIKRVAYISDRTKERKAHDSLAEALRMAQAASDAKSAFLSNVSHDIRTPMNAIIGFLALMRDEADNPGMVREYTQRIDAASQHLLGLINDVLDMNKIESGGATLNITELNLAEIIEEINTIIRPQAKAKNQTFDIFVSHLNYEHLLGDKLRLNQILINLLSNAVKYTPKDGEIQMRVDELPQVVSSYTRIRFTISDNGMGMSEDYLKVIFDPFTREETKATYEIQGTGLGMAITKSLVDLMGGTIHVVSERDKGSTFTVELELHIQEREDDPKFWTDHSVARMIVADDDEEICHNIVKTMSKTGVVTDYAADGETAVQMMLSAQEAGHPYDLILLDWMMPNLNGLETARLIREKYSDKIPILLLTAYDWSEIEQEAVEIGVNHFMPKPFFMSTFKDVIRRVMGSQKKDKDSQYNIMKDKNILIVDDIEVNRIILEKILRSQNASCDIAGNGQEAVEKFEASKPGEYDLILMDVQMPVMDGYTATKMIRSSSHPSAKTVPIIAMTANAFVDDVRDAINSGMDAHVAKPVQLDKLQAAIQQVLDKHKELMKGM